MAELPSAIRDELQSRDSLVALIESLGGKLTGGNNVRCPFHEDGRPSATIKRGDDGVWRFKCHDSSCGASGNLLDVRERAGLGYAKEAIRAAHAAEKRSSEPRSTPTSPAARADEREERSFATLEELIGNFRQIEDRYQYTDPETERIDLLVLRIQQWNREKDAAEKTFRQAHQRDDGRWVLRKPAGLLPLYNRTRLQSADWCIVVEGEKCVHALASIGIVATTSPMGAGKAKYADWSPLRGKRAYLWPDHDAIKPETKKSPGHEHMREVAEILQGFDCDVRLVDPEVAGLPRDGSDVVDFLEAIDGDAAYKRGALDIVLEQAKTVSAAAELFARIEACVDGTYRDIGFPWRAINRLTQSLLPGSIAMLCGNPGATTSYFVLESLMHWEAAGLPIACLMLEHDKAYWLQRCLAIFAENAGIVSAEWIHQNPEVARQAGSKYARALNRMARIIETTAGDASHLDLLSWLDLKSTAGCRILIIDPVTAAAATDQPWVADRNFVMRAKALARDRGFSLVLVTHPRVASKQRIAPLDDLAGGAAFQRFTQTVLLLRSHYPLREITCAGQFGNSAAQINRSILVAKATNGPGSGMEIAMDFDSQRLRFAERGLIVAD